MRCPAKMKAVGMDIGVGYQLLFFTTDLPQSPSCLSSFMANMSHDNNHRLVLTNIIMKVLLPRHLWIPDRNATQVEKLKIVNRML